MKKAVNYMRGSICARVECPYPERFVNVCAQNGIEFWRLCRESPTTVTAFMHIGGYRRLRSLAAGASFMIEPVRKTGIPFFIWRIRKRYVLLAGMVLSLLMVQAMSLFVCEIEVRGNERVSSRLILETLEEMNVGIGSFGPAVSTEAIANEMLLRIPELAWFAVNVTGSRAEVLVRERIPKPEIVDEDAPVMVYAEKSGVVVRMSVLEGATVCKVGDTIEKGDVLVTGLMESIANGKRMVHAMAEVYARTWYEISAKMPLEAVIKEHTGNTRRKTALMIGGKKINLFLNSGIQWSYYDKITKVSAARLPTGNTLPLALVTDEFMEYEPIVSALSVSDAEKILQERLLGELKEEIGGGGISSAVFETEVENGSVTVTLRAECIEQIAAERDFTEAELYEGGLQQ